MKTLTGKINKITTIVPFKKSIQVKRTGIIITGRRANLMRESFLQ